MSQTGLREGVGKNKRVKKQPDMESGTYRKEIKIKGWCED